MALRGRDRRRPAALMPRHAARSCPSRSASARAVALGLGEGAARRHLAHDVHQLLERVAGGRELARDPAPVEDDDAVGDRVDMEDVVVDEDRRLAGRPDPLHEVQELLGLLERQAHGRLVEDDDVGLEVERPHDRQALALAARQPGDARCPASGPPR